jgi:pilus assembly protein TadC
MSGSIFLAALCVSLMIALMLANPLATSRVRAPVRSRALPTWLPPLLVLVGSSVLIGGALGIALGVVLAVAASFVLPRFESAKGRRDRLARERQLPLFVDLVAACLSAGVPTDDALMAAGAAVGNPLSEIVTTAVTSIRWGAEPVRTWSSVQSIDGMRQLAGALIRSAESGAPLAELLPALAQDAREMRRARVEAKTRTAGVRLMAPLGLTFLPAFILLGVVPVVASWATLLLGNN